MLKKGESDMMRDFFIGVTVTAAAVSLLPLSGESQQTTYPVVEPIKHKPYTEKIDDKATFDMAPIPGGTFLIGSPDGEKHRNENEGPQRAVTVKPFWMAKREISWDEYDVFWENRPKGPPPRPELKEKPKVMSDAITSPTPPYEDPTFGYGRKGFPVIAVTHHAAMEYCAWLSKKTGKYYRLPTEAEWEWACRAGSTTAYSFGDDPAKLGEMTWYDKNANEAPNPVGKKNANAWGLHDMHGNVAEWCLDSYKKDFYGSLPKDKPFVLPFTPPTEDRYPNVARGGSWLDPAEKCRSAIRRFSDKSWLKRDPQRPQSIWWMTEADWVGFRVVCAVDEDPRLKGIRSKVSWWSN